MATAVARGRIFDEITHCIGNTPLVRLRRIAEGAGATVAGLAAAVAHRLSGRPLRLVVFLPAFWLLVPGSLGLLSTTELATGQAGFNAATIAIGSVVAVAAGTLIGSAAGRALDRLLDPADAPAAELGEVTDVDRL